MAGLIRGEGGDIVDHRDWWRQRQPPDNEIPVSIPVNLVLGSSADVVAYVAGMIVFSTGVQFTLELRARPGHELDGEMLADTLFNGDDGGERFLIGVEYPDGRRADTRRGPFPTPESTPGEISLLEFLGGSGGGNTVSSGFFLSPLPPPGEISFYFVWPSADMAETVSAVSADVILEAATRTRELWPSEDEPQDDANHEEPSYDLPADSWFVQTADRSLGPEDGR